MLNILKILLLSSIIKIYIIISILDIIRSSYIKKSYEILDPFYFRSKLETFLDQMENKYCSMEEGPSCYYFSKLPSDFESKHSDYNKKNQKISLLIKYLNNIINKINEKNSKTPIIDTEEGAKINLMLTFESYDKYTEKSDMYFPEELIVNPEPNLIKISVLGKLLLRNKKEGDKKKKAIENLMKLTPSNTYGITETDIELNMNKNFFVNSLYVRCGAKFNNKNEVIFELNSYKKNQIVYTTKELIKCGFNNKWNLIKVNGDMPIDKFIIPEGFEVDNISLMYLDTSIYESISSQLSKLGFNKKVQGKLNDMIKEIFDKQKYDGNDGQIKVVNLDNLIDNLDDLIPEN